MKQKEINNERYSQEEIDAIIDEIIEKEPVKEIKEHLIKYEKECREKRKTTKSMLKEEKCEYEINHPHDKAVSLFILIHGKSHGLLIIHRSAPLSQI